MSDFSTLTTEELQRLWRRYWKHGRATSLPIQHRLGAELHARELDGQQSYRSCPDCGAVIYDDGTHVLDEHDREQNGYLPCMSEEEWEQEEGEL